VRRCYVHLPALDGQHRGYSLRCIQDCDIEPVRVWRNAQMDVLRQSAPITPAQQRRYFERAIWPQMERAQPDTILLTIEQGGRRIGYGGLVHCAWEDSRAEISVLLAPQIAADQKRYRAALLAFLAMAGEIGFSRLGLNRLTLETYDIRPFHIGVLEEAGFRREGRLREHVVIDAKPVDSLLHAALARDQAGKGGRITSCATRSILVPAAGAQ